MLPLRPPLRRLLWVSGSALLNAGARHHERLLGFDARSLVVEQQAWPPERRSTYLLRPSVDQPLSTDPLVWPRILGESEGGLSTTIVEPDLTSFQQRLGRIDHRARPYAVIAVSILPVPLDPDSLRALPPPEPSTIDGAWSRLGYDVSDEALLSGLSNCAYGDGEIGALRAQWGPHLNDHHLFRDAARALEFRTITDERVPEHAPFFAYGLYEVRRASSGS
jgi:hypothetical protein